MTSTPLQESALLDEAETIADLYCDCGTDDGPRHVCELSRRILWALQSAAHTARQNALEEAAKVAEAQGWEDTAQAIRALAQDQEPA